MTDELATQLAGVQTIRDAIAVQALLPQLRSTRMDFTLTAPPLDCKVTG